MKQATRSSDWRFRSLLPGIKVTTSPTNYIRSGDAVAELARADWVRFGDVIEGMKT